MKPRTEGDGGAGAFVQMEGQAGGAIVWLMIRLVKSGRHLWMSWHPSAILSVRSHHTVDLPSLPPQKRRTTTKANETLIHLPWDGLHGRRGEGAGVLEELLRVVCMGV